jgi:hypothetical protein
MTWELLLDRCSGYHDQHQHVKFIAEVPLGCRTVPQSACFRRTELWLLPMSSRFRAALKRRHFVHAFRAQSSFDDGIVGQQHIVSSIRQSSCCRHKSSIDIVQSPDCRIKITWPRTSASKTRKPVRVPADRSSSVHYALTHPALPLSLSLTIHCMHDAESILPVEAMQQGAGRGRLSVFQAPRGVDLARRPSHHDRHPANQQHQKHGKTAPLPKFLEFSFLLNTRLLLNQHDISLLARIADTRQQAPVHQSCGDDDFLCAGPSTAL